MRILRMRRKKKRNNQLEGHNLQKLLLEDRKTISLYLEENLYREL